ncbi:MAG: hypothetical protein LBQ88_06745 [Treponema sp.]|jgi:hypothetical protein|nr:hypothetical protein [Treponema sp.]
MSFRIQVLFVRSNVVSIQNTGIRVNYIDRTPAVFLSLTMRIIATNTTNMPRPIDENLSDALISDVPSIEKTTAIKELDKKAPLFSPADPWIKKALGYSSINTKKGLRLRNWQP